LAVVILFGVIRKLIKLVLVMAAILVIYVAYLVWTGEDVDMERIKEGVQSAGESISEKADEISESMKEKVGEAVEEKLDEKTKELFSPN
jgi:F0F1-type ATP synthase membrane subunit a